MQGELSHSDDFIVFKLLRTFALMGGSCQKYPHSLFNFIILVNKVEPTIFPVEGLVKNIRALQLLHFGGEELIQKYSLSKRLQL